MSDSFSVVKKKVLQKAIFILLFLLLESLLLRKMELALGFILGAGGSFFNFWHLNRTYEKLFSGNMEQKEMLGYVYGKYSFRIAISLIVLGFSLKLGKEVFIGAIIGFLLLKASILLENLWQMIQIYSTKYLAKMRRR